MLRTPIRKTITLAILLLCVGVAGCTSLAPARRISTPEATHSYVLAGQGKPTVVLESGLGDGKETWDPIYDPISQFARVFAYDRVGYGASHGHNQSRDGSTIIRELRATLKALQQDPPYVLVGHSIGGTYMELYARTYPDEVAGVVLVDSRHADFTRRCLERKVPGCEPPLAIRVLMPAWVRDEFAGAGETEAAVRRAKHFPSVPLVVLSSGKKMPLTSERFRDLWLETQEELAEMSTQASHEVCGNCGHYVHRDNPQLVIDAVDRLVRK